jgi:hypothetical protein
VEIALRALAGEVPPDVAHEFFAMTSVRVFRELPETRRAQRIQQVAQIMKERALA